MTNADQSRARPEDAARNAASPERRYDAAICSVRCVVFPSALWSLTPPAQTEHVGELHRIERQWSEAQTPVERAAVAADAETLARRLGTRNALVELRSPGSILDEMRTTNAIIAQIDRDVAASPIEETFKAAWRAFRSDWNEFFADHQGWLDRLFYGSYEKTLEYRARAASWRGELEARGGKATGPKDTPPLAAGQAIPWKKVLLGAGITAGAVIGLHLLRER